MDDEESLKYELDTFLEDHTVEEMMLIVTNALKDYLKREENN